MLSLSELRARLHDLEADHVERTRAGQNARKIGEAICAFANDLAGRGAPGVLFVGANDDGSCAGLEVTDELLRDLAAFAQDGRIVPLPVLATRAAEIDGCRVAIVEVQPSDNPPVKFEGRVCVRRGPRRGYATPEEERRLTERRNAFNLPVDQQAVRGATLVDLDLLLFEREVLTASFAPDILEENGRSKEQQLRALRLISAEGIPTLAGILVLGINPREWLPGAYVQFVRYPGTEIEDVVADQKEIGGPLSQQLRQIDEVLAANIGQAAQLAGRIEQPVPTYPLVAVQELVRNAVLHRNYVGTATPVRLTWFADRVEITSPGGPFGEVTAENFGSPAVTAYRNPTLAAVAKDLGFVQRFGSGIARARRALAFNGNPPPEFLVEQNFVHVTIWRRP